MSGIQNTRNPFTDRDSFFVRGQPLTHPDQLYLRMVANLAAGDGPGQAVADASAREQEIFLQARAHLPKHVFDLERWKAIVGPELCRRP